MAQDIANSNNGQEVLCEGTFKSQFSQNGTHNFKITQNSAYHQLLCFGLKEKIVSKKQSKTILKSCSFSPQKQNKAAANKCINKNNDIISNLIN